MPCWCRVFAICATSLSNFNLKLKGISWKDLYASKFIGALNFQLECAEGEILFVDEIIRHVPQRRLAAIGRWRGDTVFIKLFFDPKQAKRHVEMDQRGNQILEQNKIPTPKILYKGTAKEKKIHILLFEYIEAKNLEQIWRARVSDESVMPIFKSLMVELATQHVLGVLQHDLHLKNFLVTDKTIYTVDGAQIAISDYLLPKKLSIHNVALLLSQLGVGCESMQKQLFTHYAKSRGWLLKPEDNATLFANIREWDTARWQHFQKKIFRNCSDFACIADWHMLMMYDKKYARPEFIQFLRNPESLFQHPKAILLKSGRSATVIKITLDNREFVIKRYNIKNMWHYLRRCFRPTRAATCWRLAQKLYLFGVTTAKPIAFIETRYLGLRGKSYYVTEYIDGNPAKVFFSQQKYDQAKVKQSILQVVALFKNLMKVEITHGDLKATNILINDQGNPYLIDLDGAKEQGRHRLRSAWRKEIKRFLKNFGEQPTVLNQFQQVLESKEF